MTAFAGKALNRRAAQTRPERSVAARLGSSALACRAATGCAEPQARPRVRLSALSAARRLRASSLCSGAPHRGRRGLVQENPPQPFGLRPKIAHSPTLAEERPLVHSRRAQSRHALPLRPSRGPEPPGRTSASGAAFTHPHPVLFDEGHAGPSTSSTGSRTRSPTISRASSSPTKHEELRIEVDLVAEMAVPESLRLLPRAVRRPSTHSSTRNADQRELAPYLIDSSL